MKLNDFKQFNESAMTCSECGGPAFSDLILAEKQDACYNKVKSRYKVWPSAYASGALVQCRKKGAANWGNKSEGRINEFAPPGSSDGGNDGFSEETLKRLAAQWWNGDEDPRVEQTLGAAGWEIGQDEGYDNGGAFVVQAGDINGNSYISWPAEELEGLSEGVSKLGYDAQSLIMKLRRDVEEKRLQPTRQAVLSAARELAGDMDFAPELLVRQVLGQGVAEGSEQINELSPETLKSYANKARAQVRASPGANPNNSHLPTDPKIANRARGAVKADNRLHGFGPAKKSTQGVAEGLGQDSPVAQAITRRILMQRTDLLAKYGPGYVGQAIDDVVDSVGDVEEIGSSDVSGWVRQVEHNLKNKLNRYDEPMNVGDALDEEHNPEYDDEAGMADNNLETLARAVEGIDDLIQSGDNLPEWCQEKIAVAKSMLVAVWDYMYSEEASDEVDPEVDEMFEAMESLVEEIAVRENIDVDLVWESFESLDDHMLYETAAWRRKEGKSKSGGLNAKGVASYRRENPGSKLQMAVTTKPSKLKKGSKAAKRRKSFCARMSGVKGPMKKPNGKPTRKALALRKWNC